MKFQAIGVSVFALMSAALAPGGAIAQPSQTPAIQETEEVVVVARRRAENIEKVPLAVTAISGDDLANRGLTRAEDLQQAVPNLRIFSATARSDQAIVLRGQGPAPIFSGNRTIPGATAYFAEVPTNFSGSGAFTDLQSVQVVKGPQGTLFGRNTTGGALLLVPTKPGNEFGGYVTGQLGSYSDREIQGAINIPIVKNKLNLRLTTRVAHRDGYTENVATGKNQDDVNYQYYRASIDFRPIDGLDNYTILSFQNVHQHGSSHILAAVNPDLLLQTVSVPSFLGCTNNRLSVTFGGTLSLSGACRAGLFPDPTTQNALARQQALGPRKVDSSGPTLDKENNYGLTNITTYELTDNLTIKNILGYRLDQATQNQDLTGGNLPVLRDENNSGDGWATNFQQMTEEFQLQGKSFNKRLEWIVGTYLEFIGEGPGDARVRSVTLGQTPQIRDTRISDTSKSLFGEATYDFSDWLPGFKFTAGLRQNYDTRKATVRFCALNSVHCDALQPGLAPEAAVQSASTSFRNLSYNFTATYEFNDHVTSYVGYKRGYRQGGFVLPAPLVGASVFSPEVLTEIEVGTKYAFHALSGPGHLNVALFRDHYVGRQVLGGTAEAVGGGITTLTTNLGTSDYLGAEIEGLITPFRGFNLSAWYSYIHAPNGVARILFGEAEADQTDQTPISKYGIAGAYTLPFIPDSLGSVTFRADWSWQAHSSIGAVIPDPVNSVSSYGLLNLRMSWDDIANSHVSASVFATNALDKTYIAGAIPIFSQIGTDSIVYGEPRMIGGTLTYKFGAEAE